MFSTEALPLGLSPPPNQALRRVDHQDPLDACSKYLFAKRRMSSGCSCRTLTEKSFRTCLRRASKAASCSSLHVSPPGALSASSTLSLRCHHSSMRAATLGLGSPLQARGETPEPLADSMSISSWNSSMMRLSSTGASLEADQCPPALPEYAAQQLGSPKGRDAAAATSALSGLEDRGVDGSTGFGAIRSRFSRVSADTSACAGSSLAEPSPLLPPRLP
mmetsp:Transcript_39969/g.94977  ORF Transcript_39969/g.94977 Transcript_39969/m.94977 type:complete len:219 (+) Transcript_39969:282-938(+)